MSTTMSRSSLISGLAGFGFALVGLAGCFTVEFDENRAEVYYCTGDADCLDSQACIEFRCVDDSGPQVSITIPEPQPLTVFSTTDEAMAVDYRVTDFVISDSNAKVEGQGKILASIDNQEFKTISVTPDGVELAIPGGLPAGAHRLWVQAVYGDETPYSNPGATAYVPFFVAEPAAPASERPQIAITSPGPNRTHVVGEPLEVSIAVRNFDIVDNGNDCFVDEACDPWDPATADCFTGECPLVPAGHSHIYIEPDYPACLFDTPIGCNGDYILSLRPSESVDSTSSEATAVIPGNRFDEAGTYTFTATLQYNNHDPYPNNEHVIFDQITLTVVE